jgi:hypothetical protein
VISTIVDLLTVDEPHVRVHQDLFIAGCERKIVACRSIAILNSHGIGSP